MTLVLSLTFPGFSSTTEHFFYWFKQYYNPIVTAALYMFMALTFVSALITVVGTYRITKIIRLLNSSFNRKTLVMHGVLIVV
jgi:hypothetical protein